MIVDDLRGSVSGVWAVDYDLPEVRGDVECIVLNITTVSLGGEVKEGSIYWPLFDREEEWDPEVEFLSSSRALTAALTPLVAKCMKEWVEAGEPL